MSSRDGPGTAADGNAKDGEGLGAVLPAPLVPLYARLRLVQAFRETHGSTYTKALEAMVAVLLIGGYVYWLYLYVGLG